MKVRGDDEQPPQAPRPGPLRDLAGVAEGIARLAPQSDAAGEELRAYAPAEAEGLIRHIIKDARDHEARRRADDEKCYPRLHPLGARR